MKIRALLVILLTLACAGAYAQDGGVKGKVVSRDGRVALSNVKVVVEPLGVTVMTDNHGNFNIDQLPKGEYQLKFEAPEFENLDLAIRVGRVGSENLVARHIGETELLVAAAPEYLERAGSPANPEELVRHDCLTYTYASIGNQWSFEDKTGKPINVRIGGPIHANNGMLLAEIAAAGGGIALAPCFILQPLIDSGRLRRVLPDWNTPHLPIHAVYPTRRHLSAKVQAMASFLKDWFAAQ
mgnify:CR=1 FL=1